MIAFIATGNGLICPVCGALNNGRVIYRVRVITPKFGINKRHGQK